MGCHALLQGNHPDPGLEPASLTSAELAGRNCSLPPVSGGNHHSSPSGVSQTWINCKGALMFRYSRSCHYFFLCSFLCLHCSIEAELGGKVCKMEDQSPGAIQDQRACQGKMPASRAEPSAGVSQRKASPPSCVPLSLPPTPSFCPVWLHLEKVIKEQTP